MSNYFEKLKKLEGAIKIGENDPLLHCLQTPSPSMNWAFAIPGHGLPFGYSMMLYGPPKGGKSIICNAIIGQLHKDDPKALAITFNTELRGEIQANNKQLQIWGIDPERFIVYNVNQPELIFDRIEQEIAAACQNNEPIKLIVIDSLKGIQGRRALNASSVLQQQIGDEAATIQDGLKRILPVIRKYKIALILTTHIRAEIDPKEQMRGKTIKMASAWASKHMAEFFIYVEPNLSKEGRTSLNGNGLIDEQTKDLMDRAQQTGHKVRFRVEASTLGPSGRTAEFTLDYYKGIINTHEEIFLLGKNTGVIQRPNQMSYQYKDKIWRGLSNCLIALRDESELAQQILQEVYSKDCSSK